MTDPSKKDVRAVVLRAAGTNCEGETVRALELAGAEVELLHLNQLTADPRRLDDARILIIAGGFSYGDYVAAGRVFGIELARRLREPLERFVADNGLVVGVCNGFQVLVELGMFQRSGSLAPKRTIALTDNASNHYECRWVTLGMEDSACPWLEAGTVLPCPVAHAEGRFVVRDPDALAELVENRQIALRYIDPEAVPSSARDEELPYPLNPNGSAANIAGISDPTGLVLGLMPHPERNLSPWNHPEWTRREPRPAGEGLDFYRRMVDFAAHPAGVATP